MRKMGLAGVLVAGFVLASCAPDRETVREHEPTPAPTEPAPPSALPETASPTAAPSASAALAAAPAPTGPASGLAARRETRAVGGVDFALLGGLADLYVEAAITPADTAVLAEQATADVRAVEREFEMRFVGRPEIYVFATTASYAVGMARIFGYPVPTADWIAENTVAFFEPPLGIIGVNWEALRDRRPIAAIRHELTHLLTLSACAPRCDLVPAWLNEGQARLAETLIPGADWRQTRVRYEAASMATTGTLIPLAELVAQGSWNALTSWAGYYKYQEAARATELLREDIGGDAPIARLYERIRRGENVAQAYARLTGRSFDTFVAELPARMRAAADVGVVTVATGPDGPGPSYLVYGFAPSAAVDVTFTGKRERLTWRAAVSPFGAVFDSLPADLPRGLYEVTVTDGKATVTAKVMKRAGADGWH